ncbi:MAG: VOC family protein [Gemmatimonadales bacterium]
MQLSERPPVADLRVDHLVYATPDLSRGIDELDRLLGIRAAPGGQHPGLGTRNALIALGSDSYIEIIAPDPAQPAPSTPRWFGIDALEQSRLVAWAAKGTNLDELRANAVQRGIALGAVSRGARQRPDGVALAWQLTDPRVWLADGVVPFFIDWGPSPHPARSAPAGATLVALRAEHPDAPRVRLTLRLLGIAVPVQSAPHAALVATIDCPRGRVEMR